MSAILSDNCNIRNLLNKVKCKLDDSHKLFIDASTYQIVCKTCKNSNNLIFINLDNNENSYAYCSYHKDEEGSYFCLDCNEFICSLCICLKHRYHNSNIPSELKETIVNNTNQLSSVISLIIQDSEVVKQDLTTFKSNIEDLKASILSKKQMLSLHISKEVTSKSNELLSKIPDYINSKQEALTEQYLARCNSDLRKISSFLEAYEKLRNIINKGFLFNANDEINTLSILNNTSKEAAVKSLSNNIIYIKDKINIAQEIIDRSKEINSETDDVTENYYILIENKMIYNELIDTKVKEINSIFDTINNSLLTFYISRNYTIRRFTSYFNPGVTFFEKTSVYIDNLNDFPIRISGFGLCGLVSTRDRCTLKVELSILEIPEKEDTGNKECNDKIPYLDDDSTLELLYKEKLLLKEIDFTNSNNPTQTVYLSKYVKDLSKSLVELKAKRRYKIKISNVDSDFYINLWNGKTITKDFINMFKEKKTSYLSQELICNTNDIVIGISSSDSTDLNEFSNGIISDIIYSL